MTNALQASALAEGGGEDIGGERPFGRRGLITREREGNDNRVEARRGATLRRTPGLA